MTNSCAKGKRGERMWRDELRAMGFGSDTRRGQQFSGGKDSPDVVFPALAHLHCEVKVGYPSMDLGTKALDEAINQAKRDAVSVADVLINTMAGCEVRNPQKNHYVAWKPDRKPWRLTYRCPTLGVYVTVTGRESIATVLRSLK